MKLIIDDIVFKTSFVQPYENICFVDTPGFNPGSNQEQDYNTTITAIAGAQALLWCFDVSGGTIHGDDFTILQDILNVNSDIRIYIIANRADLKSMDENAEILEQADILLQTNAIAYEGISLYTARQKFNSQPEEYAVAMKGKSLADFLSENNKPDTRKEEDLLKLVSNVFDEYIEADDELINETNKKIQESKSNSSRFLYILGKNEEIISDIKSHISQTELKRMGANVTYGADDIEEYTDAVSQFMEGNLRTLQATLHKALADKVAARNLCRKFMKCIGSIFGNMDVLHKIYAKEDSNVQETVQWEHSTGAVHVHGKHANYGCMGPENGGNSQSSQITKRKKQTERLSRKNAKCDGFGTARVTISESAKSHRNNYRGKDLTSAFDNGTFSESLADGSFNDIYPGDYIIKSLTIPATDGRREGTYEIKFVIAELLFTADLCKGGRTSIFEGYFIAA